MNTDEYASIARRYYLALRFPDLSGQNPKVPESTRQALNAQLQGGNVAWGLSLVLAAWRIIERGGADATLTELLKSSGAVDLVAQIASIRMALPQTFTKFLELGESPDDSKTAAAASYFASTTADLNFVSRGALHNWLAAKQFSQVAEKLIQAVGGAPGATTKAFKAASASGPRPAFDRQDFSSRPATQPEQRGQVTPDPAKPEPPSPEPAKDLGDGVDKDSGRAKQAELVENEVDLPSFVTAYLLSLGWPLSDISRVLAGPDKSHLTAERMFRVLGAQTPEVRAAVLDKLERQGHLDASTHDPVAIEDHDPSHLVPVKPQNSDAATLLAEFLALPAVQQQRFAALLGEYRKEAATKGDAGNKGADPTGTAIKLGLDVAEKLIRDLFGGSSSGKKPGGTPTKKTPKVKPKGDDDRKDPEEKPDAEGEGSKGDQSGGDEEVDGGSMSGGGPDDSEMDDADLPELPADDADGTAGNGNAPAEPDSGGGFEGGGTSESEPD